MFGIARDKADQEKVANKRPNGFHRTNIFLIQGRHLSTGGIIIAEKETRNFALRDAQGNEIGVFSGKSPRQAALKAANRGYTDIKLRERGTKKVHIFTGERVQVDKPASAPAWMPDKIWKPKVKKVGIEKLEEV
jgi:hypothetical protein